jgi:hypothetical protein
VREKKRNRERSEQDASENESEKKLNKSPLHPVLFSRILLFPLAIAVGRGKVNLFQGIGDLFVFTSEQSVCVCVYTMKKAKRA